MCWDVPITPALGRLKQKGHEFKTSLGHTEGVCLQMKKSRRKKEMQTKRRWETEIFQHIPLEEFPMGKGGIFFLSSNLCVGGGCNEKALEQLLYTNKMSM